MPPARRAKVDAAATIAAASASTSKSKPAAKEKKTTTTTTTTTPATKKTTRSTTARTPAATRTATTAAAAAHTTITNSRSRSAAKAKRDDTGADVDAGGDADDLVKGLGKLSIQLGEPVSPTSTKAPTKRAVRKTPATEPKATPAATSSSKATTTAASSSSKATTTAPSRKTAAPTKTLASTTSKAALLSTKAAVPSTSSSSIITKGKAKEQDVLSALERSLPWAVYDVDNPRKPLERARMAMDAVNTSSKSLSTALSSGYRYQSASKPNANASKDTSRTQTEEINGDQKAVDIWTNGKVETLVETCQIGIRVLRGLEEQGYLPGKAADLERSCQSVIAKCVSMGMPSRAMELNVASRPYILRLYKHRASTQSGTPPSTPALAPARKTQVSIPKPITKFVATVSARTPSASASTSASQVPNEWLEMARLPVPEEGSAEPGEQVKTVLFSAMMAAWISLVIVHSDKDAILPVLTVPRSLSGSDADQSLHPLVLANHMPRASSVTHLHALYRQVTLLSHPTSSRAYLPLRHLSFLSLSHTISPSPDSKATPTQFWDTVHRCLVGYVREDEIKSRLKEAAEVADRVVTWVEQLVILRDEKGWFEGRAWLAFVEMWIGLGRRLGDSGVIDKPLSLLTSTTSISSSSAIISSLSDGRPKIKNPEAEVARICGDLAKASLVLDKSLSTGSLTAIVDHIERLSSSELVLLAQAVTCLPRDDAILDTAGKAIRAWERVRRGCTKAYDRSKKPETAAQWSKASGEIGEWLESSLEFVEILVDASILDQALNRDVMNGSVDTLVYLYRSEHAKALLALRRIQRLQDASRSIAKPVDQMEWCRCLSSLAYNGGAQLYKQSKIEEAIELTRMSCDWTTEAFGLSVQIGQLNENLQKGITHLKGAIGGRWELLAGCYQRISKREEMFTAYSHCIATQPPSIITQLSTSASFMPLNEAYASVKDIAALTRLASLILYDPSSFLGHGLEMVNFMQEAKLGSEAIGAMIEKLLSLLEDVQWKDEGARACFELADALLSIYGDNYPIRRIRTIAKMMGIITASGKQAGRFPSLVKEVDRLVALTDLGEDTSLAPYKAEYVSYTLIYRAIQSYHCTSPTMPSAEVIEASQEAVKALRSIVLPPTNTSTSTPIKTKVGEGSVSIAAAGGKKIPLGSLGSLLGMLGCTLQQIDVLKLLRAFQRNNEDLINDYVKCSSQLATEYQNLGKTSRAGFVFQQALRVVENGKTLVLPNVKVELLLRYACYLAAKGETARAQDAYMKAEALEKDIEAITVGTYFVRVVDRTGFLERGAWARKALSAIYISQDNAAGAISQLSAGFRLFSRASDAICRIASVYPDPKTPAIEAIAADDPFGAPPPSSDESEPKPSGADEPSKDSKVAPPSQTTHFKGKHLYEKQWHIASSLISTAIDLATAFAYRGSVRDAEYFLNLSSVVADAVKSKVLGARIGTRQAEILFRMRKWEQTGETLETAAGSLNMMEGPDMIDLNRLKGDLYARTEMVEEAGEVFESTSKEIAGLDAVFTAAEAVIPSPRKNALLAASTNSVRASLTPSKAAQGGKEPLLPVVLAHVLRQHAWLLREAGAKDECEMLLAQLRSLSSSTETKAEELLLEGRIALHEAFNTFKTDLFMSSLTESAVAMPMGNPTKRIVDRQSTRLSIQTVLTRAEEAFLSALSIASGSGKIEGIRQACLALALLRAFQTSLGHGSELITASAADILASSSSITLQRELLEAIECKFTEGVNADLKWPPKPFELAVETEKNGAVEEEAMDVDAVVTEDLDDHDGRLRMYWDMIKSKYASRPLVSTESLSLESLPAEWAVISINVTDDHNTMFISRHQRDCDPIVFCLPLDRQGKREGEDGDDLWTFDAGLAEFAEIIRRSDATSRNARNVFEREDKIKWWDERFACDAKMKVLCESMEFVWLGAFKTIFSPRIPSFQHIVDNFRERLEKIFISALSSTSGGGSSLALGIPQPRLSSKARPTISAPRSSLSASQVHLEDSLLQCFAKLSSKAKDEEIEDLVYFILDVYQFHGVPVALSELDIDQIAIDVRGALEKIETPRSAAAASTPKDEHIFLALDKNVSCLPWESIPILRSRAVSRVPSLSFLLDQVAMGAHLRPSLTQGQNQLDTRRTINARRTFYILNPSGDLTNTQGRFDPWLKEMVETAGWKGIIGRPPTELELVAALKDYDLVIYIGHGGAEQYIRSHKVRHLPQCATTMLWGCSSGHLKDQGEFDRTGTAWNYMVAGCPSLTANLWDVTDADIDRLSLHVLKGSLKLDAAHLPDSKSRTNTLLPLSEKSITQAVNSSRDECKLRYLTGAAPVVYGLPVYLH
ncbi:hypothetical protein I316_02863 [Kwoniella heveanensis BCC8398]|uniref:separase n=1 Tax=Kwoniella heveanensis BCC8398 TaxID=1296120 RepID=A0A1B9GWA2_9TREE|nr:hypothetical protein I316_02863 [Kwoniella heveanensis BCC8398]